MAKINVPIDAKILYQMYEYAAYAEKHFKSEISGWAHYHPDKGIYKLAPLCKQEVSGAEVDNFPDEILNNMKYDISDMIVQWHSHVNMPTFQSQTDKNNIAEALDLFPCLISIVVNCKNEYTATLDYNVVGTKSMQVLLEENQSVGVNLVPYYANTKISDEVLAKCSRPVPKLPTGSIIHDYRSYGVGKNYNYVGTPSQYDLWKESKEKENEKTAKEFANEYLATIPSEDKTFGFSQELFIQTKLFMKSMENINTFNFSEYPGGAILLDYDTNSYLDLDLSDLTLNGNAGDTIKDTFTTWGKMVGIVYSVKELADLERLDALEKEQIKKMVGK